MTLSFDLYYSLRSPYSYLLLPQLDQALAKYDLAVNVKPVYPLAIRTPDFFQRVDSLFAPYLLRDTMRVSQILGIPYAWPKPDPVKVSMENGRMVIPAEQPHIHRLTRLGVAACETENGYAFVRKIAHVIWSGEVSGWPEGEHLAQAAAKAGFDLAALDRAVTAEPDRYDRIIDASQQAQRAAGHWGVPLMVYDGEPFFGQDRLSHLLWRLKQHGLQER